MQKHNVWLLRCLILIASTNTISLLLISKLFPVLCDFPKQFLFPISSNVWHVRLSFKTIIVYFLWVILEYYCFFLHAIFANDRNVFFGYVLYLKLLCLACVPIQFHGFCFFCRLVFYSLSSQGSLKKKICNQRFCRCDVLFGSFSGFHNSSHLFWVCRSTEKNHG